jgi:hypothetical protein
MSSAMWHHPEEIRASARSLVSMMWHGERIRDILIGIFIHPQIRFERDSLAKWEKYHINTIPCYLLLTLICWGYDWPEVRRHFQGCQPPSPAYCGCDNGFLRMRSLSLPNWRRSCNLSTFPAPHYPTKIRAYTAKLKRNTLLKLKSWVSSL